MNKREEFEKALEDLIEYVEQATSSYPLEPAREREYSGYADEEKAKLLALFDAAQPPQDGLPELPEPFSYPKGNIVGPCVCGSWPGGECQKCVAVNYYTADQMLAYGAQCRAAAIPVSPEQQKILDFLYGIGEIEGKAFGERAQNEAAFWWRKHLKAAFPLLAAAPKGEGK